MSIDDSTCVNGHEQEPANQSGGLMVNDDSFFNAMGGLVRRASTRIVRGVSTYRPAAVMKTTATSNHSNSNALEQRLGKLIGWRDDSGAKTEVKGRRKRQHANTTVPWSCR